MLPPTTTSHAPPRSRRVLALAVGASVLAAVAVAAADALLAATRLLGGGVAWAAAPGRAGGGSRPGPARWRPLPRPPRRVDLRPAAGFLSAAGGTNAFGFIRGKTARWAEKEGESESVDWRDFRARLVQQELKERKPTLTPGSPAPAEGEGAAAGAPAAQEEGWAYATPIIEQGSLLLSVPGDHFSINQQYFHKCVIFIVEHTDDFTRGVILNRPTAFSTTDLDQVIFDLDSEERHKPARDVASLWNVWCGGDCHGLNSREDPRSMGLVYSCLHTQERLGQKSREIIRGAFSIDLAEAQQLVDSGAADLDDFLLLVGYCGWGPGQLQAELDRGGTWDLAAADQRLLLGKLRDQQATLRARLRAAAEPSSPGGGDAAAPQMTFQEVGDGLAEWERLFCALGPEYRARFDAEHREDSGDKQGTHTDKMLQRWISRCLIPPRLQPLSLADVPSAFAGEDFKLPTGAVLRGSATAWLLGKAGEGPGLDAGRATATGLPGQWLHKAVLLLVDGYTRGADRPAVLVMLNGPTLDADQDVHLGGFGGARQTVYKIKTPGDDGITYKVAGHTHFAPSAFDALLNIGALEVADGVEAQAILAAPRHQRWAAAGGTIKTPAEATEAALGDEQQRKFYSRFLRMDFPPEES